MKFSSIEEWLDYQIDMQEPADDEVECTKETNPDDDCNCVECINDRKAEYALDQILDREYYGEI